MKSTPISGRVLFLLAILIFLVLVAVYDIAFYAPLQDERKSIENQAAELDAQIALAKEQCDKMDAMQAELNEILAHSGAEGTEIPPYDNAKAVTDELYPILLSTLSYQLSFSEPKEDTNGIVRRTVNITFQCSSYRDAKSIIEKISDRHWRCLITGLSVDSSTDLLSDAPQVHVSILFFERSAENGNVQK